MSHTCDKNSTALCVQAVGACQALSATNVLSGYVRHILCGVKRVLGHLFVSVTISDIYDSQSLQTPPYITSLL